jgi:formamidopyrimidine-DNA glycosylase
MPELPEVETVVRGLRATVVGRTIKRVRTHAPAASIVVSPSFGNASFHTLLEGKTVVGIDRRGKNILMRLSGECTLWVHLKMTGHFLYVAATAPADRHDLVVFDFEPEQAGRASRDRKAYHLRFNDYRRFGRLRLFPDAELDLQKGLADLGPEPLELSTPAFVALCRYTSRMIKPALLDQTFLAGLGNIYADEALYAARIHPRRNTASVSPKKLIELHGHIRRLLRLAIAKMGTSVNSYSGVNGQPGSFQKYLEVYGNEGGPCRFCGGRIVREKIGSRSAHFCPRCQRLR